MKEPGREISRAILIAPMLISGQSPPPYSQLEKERKKKQSQERKMDVSYNNWFLFWKDQGRFLLQLLAFYFILFYSQHCMVFEKYFIKKWGGQAKF